MSLCTLEFVLTYWVMRACYGQDSDLMKAWPSQDVSSSEHSAGFWFFGHSSWPLKSKCVYLALCSRSWEEEEEKEPDRGREGGIRKRKKRDEILQSVLQDPDIGWSALPEAYKDPRKVGRRLLEDSVPWLAGGWEACCYHCECLIDAWVVDKTDAFSFLKNITPPQPKSVSALNSHYYLITTCSF